MNFLVDTVVWGTFGNHSFVLSGQKPVFGAKILPKWCYNDNHAKPIKPLMSFGDGLFTEEGWSDKRSSFPGVTTRNPIFCRYFDWFPSQGSNRINCHCSCILMRVCPK